jgi:hypothetical protein
LTPGSWTIASRTLLRPSIKFGAQRILEALERMLGGAIGRLQRDAAKSERRADQHDDAGIARQHVAKRGAGAVDLAEVGDVGDPPIFLRTGIDEARKEAGEGVVHPDVDAAEMAGGHVGGLIDGIGVGDVSGDDQRLAAEFINLAGGGFETVAAARQQGDAAAAPGELAGGGTADAGRCPGNDGNLGQWTSARWSQVPLQCAERAAGSAQAASVGHRRTPFIAMARE